MFKYSYITVFTTVLLSLGFVSGHYIPGLPHGHRYYRPPTRPNVYYNRPSSVFWPSRDQSSQPINAPSQNGLSVVKPILSKQLIKPKKSYQCGGVLSKFKIYGGTEAGLGSHPWIAALGFRNEINGTFSWLCSGTLINDQYVLTAAHCLIDPNLKLSMIRLGDYNLNTKKDCIETRRGPKCIADYQEFHPQLIVKHELFNLQTFSDDIAIIKLHQPVKITAYVHPICLPPENLDVKGLIGNHKAFAVGWGNVNTTDRSERLQQVSLPYVDHDKCTRVLPLSINPDKQLCFGGQPGKDSCRGDSGGPVIFPRNINRPPYILVGIISFGSEICGIKGVPGIYTNVSAYLDWIRRITG